MPSAAGVSGEIHRRGFSRQVTEHVGALDLIQGHGAVGSPVAVPRGSAVVDTPFAAVPPGCERHGARCPPEDGAAGDAAAIGMGGAAWYPQSWWVHRYHATWRNIVSEYRGSAFRLSRKLHLNSRARASRSCISLSEAIRRPLGA